MAKRNDLDTYLNTASTERLKQVADELFADAQWHQKGGRDDSARALGTAFADFDAEITRRRGR